MKRRGWGLLLGVLGSLMVRPAAAQSSTGRPASSSSSLLAQLGAPAAERLLASDASRDRLRGLARLSALGTPRAVELLARALDPGGAARGAQEHLAAVRALAPHARLAPARDALVRALSSPAVESDAGPLSEWVQSSAALALARTQDAAALSALGRALRKPGHAAELTRDALVAYPPRDITQILRVPGAPTKELCETLGQLGDRRAEGFLREIVRRGAPEARAAAALALLSLGSNEVVPLARHWLRSERQPVLVAAAVEILTRRATPDAGQALAQLAAADGARELSLTLLLRTDGRFAGPPILDAELRSSRGPELLELFARGGAWASPRLERALRDPESAGLACYALSRAPSDAAQVRLERALSEASLRPFALRALALRSARLARESAALLKQLPSSLRSSDGAERAAAAFARALLDPAALLEGLAASDPVVVRASARLALSGEAARAAVRRLEREQDSSLQTALSIGLADPDAAALVSTPSLLELAHAAGPGSLLAAAALGARKDADLSPLLRELLASGDPWLRAHALLGLARAPSPDAIGLIEAAYRFEPEASVRHAAVVALSQRTESVRLRTLSLAAELDGSSAVREAARLALSGHGLTSGVTGPETAWLELVKNPGQSANSLPVALVRFGDGLALPVVADPDGVAVLAGVDPGLATVRLALLEERGNVRRASP
jgi:cellulose synthase operon protein C